MWSRRSSLSCSSRVTPTASKRIVAHRRACAPILGEPSAREAAQTQPLARAQPCQRLLLGGQPARVRGQPARLHLDEHERAPVAGDQVDLTGAGAHVAGEHGEAQPLEVLCGELLAARAERAARILSVPGPSMGAGSSRSAQRARGLGRDARTARMRRPGGDRAAATGPPPGTATAASRRAAPRGVRRTRARQRARFELDILGVADRPREALDQL